MLRIKSDKPDTNAVYFGPSHIADKMIGTKLKLIASNWVLIDKNLDNTSDSASISPDNITFFVFDIFCIKKAPFGESFYIYSIFLLYRNFLIFQ